jgi:hypothetical protein
VHKPSGLRTTEALPQQINGDVAVKAMVGLQSSAVVIGRPHMHEQFAGEYGTIPDTCTRQYAGLIAFVFGQRFMNS